MAIETTYIYSTDNSGVLAWLQANAVPTYFDSVVADEETSSTIHCYVGKQELLKIHLGTKSSVQFTATNAAGKSSGCTYSYAGYYAIYGYKTACGLAIAAGSSSTQYIPIFITKDSSDHTTVILSGTITSQTSAGTVSCVDVVEIQSITTNPVSSSVTTLVPFVCGNAVGETRYTPNAFYMPTAQYTTIGKLMIDGVAYLSNGAWLLKDA